MGKDPLRDYGKKKRGGGGGRGGGDHGFALVRTNSKKKWFLIKAIFKKARSTPKKTLASKA